MQVINTDLMKHPMNWLIVFLMVLIAIFAAHWIKELVAKQ